MATAAAVAAAATCLQMMLPVQRHKYFTRLQVENALVCVVTALALISIVTGFGQLSIVALLQIS